ncbi:MAG: hypothetical protein JSR70_11655 [Proteobacteria bacterium]|nr:hypothetical protein [Pseudomonadota bacterium]
MNETTPDNIRKVPASAGAQWLIDGFMLLKASPGGLGAMGVMYGVLAAVVVGMSAVAPEIGFVLQTALLLVVPLLTGGLVWAAREVAQGRSVGLASYGEPFRQGKVGALLFTLLPQVVLGLSMAILLLVLVGSDNLQVIASVMEKMQSAGPGAQPDPALIASLPAGRMLLWLLCVVVLALVMFLMTFVAVPDIMLGGSSGLQALRRSWRAGVRNLPAVLVFIGVALVTLIGISLLAGIVGVIVRMIAGSAAQAMVSQLLTMAIIVPIVWGAIGRAWQSMLGQDAVPPALPTGQLQA